MPSYDELATPSDLRIDCEAVNRQLAKVARKATLPAPSIHFDEMPRETRKRDIEISEAAQRLANALQLHLD